jgi:integrase
MCSYLYRRGAVYCTRLAVPLRLRPIIGKSDLGRSLRTKDLAEAKRRLPSWLEWAQSTLAAAGKELARQAGAAGHVGANDTERSITSLAMDLGMIHEAEPDHFFPSEPEPVAIARSELREMLENKVLLEQIKHRSGPAYPAPSVGTMLDTNIVDLWAAERKPKQKGIDTHRAVARWFYERVSKKPVDQITRQDVLAFKSKLLEEGQSAANIKMKLSRLRTLLQWAADNGHAASNAAQGITIKDAQAAKNKRRPFDLAALNAIFASPVYSEGDRPTRGRGEAAYWIPLLALFTGARMEELGQLRPSDIVQVTYADPDGRDQTGWFLHLVAIEGDEGTQLKNAASERLVPIHPELERLGFIAFAQAMKDQKRERLFYLLTPGPYGNLTHKWGQWFSDYLRKVCLVTDRRMTFHSFRHTFTDYVRRPDIPEGVQRQLVGHSSKDVHDDYGSGYNLHWLTESMKLYKVPGLKLP